MKIFFVTIVKDGMPFVSWHYPVFRSLPVDWTWHVVEGTAAPEACTSWCAPISPGLSSDGTSELLHSLSAFDRRVRIFLRHSYWHGKVAMFNAALEWLNEPCLLWQVDADEVWTSEQIMQVVGMFEKDKKKNCARFFCRYFVGPNIAITSRDGYGNNSAYEWHRVWKVNPGARFKTHEPPCLESFEERPFTQEQTEAAGIVFDHWAYATEAQVRFKEKFYGSTNNKLGHLYAGAIGGWKRLQANRTWPTDLKPFMPWVGNDVIVERIQ